MTNAGDTARTWTLVGPSIHGTTWLVQIGDETTPNPVSDPPDFTLCLTVDQLMTFLVAAGYEALETDVAELRQVQEFVNGIRRAAGHNAIGQGKAACGASPAPEGCAANGTNNERTDK